MCRIDGRQRERRAILFWAIFPEDPWPQAFSPAQAEVPTTSWSGVPRDWYSERRIYVRLFASAKPVSDQPGALRVGPEWFSQSRTAFSL